jgi:hypothetical protein
MSASLSRLTILQLVPEPLPTHRPDLTDLFGNFLPRLGIDCNILGHARQSDGAAVASAWAHQDGHAAHIPLHRAWCGKPPTCCWRSSAWLARKAVAWT